MSSPLSGPLSRNGGSPMAGFELGLDAARNAIPSAPGSAAVIGSNAKAAEAFESMLVGFLAKEMHTSKGLFGEGPGAMFGDLFDQKLGDIISSGRGLGLKAQIERSLDRSAGGGFSLPRLRPADGTTQTDHRHGIAPAVARITSHFGFRNDPIEGDRRKHDGVDIGLPLGSPVHAVREGVVRTAGGHGGYGNVIIIDHGDGFETRYAHCSEVDVTPGTHVSAGQVIGRVGNTGRSTGPHLHLEARLDGVAVDPQRWADAAAVGR